MSQVFPAHWDVLPFSLAVKDATSEYSKLQKSEYLEQGRFPIVDQGQNKFGGYTNDESVVSLDGCPAIVFGDHTRIFKFIDEPFCLGADGAKVLESKVELDRKFLFYYLSSLNIESAGYSRHFKFLKENVVPVPPLPEQKRIATILDKADAIRRKRQQAIQLADDFLRAVFLDMFGDPVTNSKGWETERLEELVRVVSGATPSKSNDDYWIGDFPWVSPKDMKSLDIKSSIDHINQIVFERENLKKLPVGSVLIVVRGMILAHTVPVGITSTEVAINQDIKAFISSGRVLPEFLLWFLLSQHANLLSKVTTAAHGTKRFDMDDLLSLPVFVPQLEIQSDFVSIARSYKATLDELDWSHKGALELSNSLGQRAFAGQL